MDRKDHELAASGSPIVKLVLGASFGIAGKDATLTVTS